MQIAYFTAGEGDAIVPTRMAQSAWSKEQIHGVAVSGALARSLERAAAEAGYADFHPSRYAVDMFKAAVFSPATFETEVVRAGRRICLVDTVMSQDGVPVARASAVFLKPSENAPSEVWAPTERLSPPPTDVVPPSEEPRVPFIHSSAGWSQDFSEHQNASRKMTWQTGLPTVAGEQVSPFEAVAGIADATSMTTNWGAGGIEYINTDITLTLARRPVGLEVGLAAIDRVECDGIAVGVVAVFDRVGHLGNAMTSALANTRRSVDMSAMEYDDDGQRRPRNA